MNIGIIGSGGREHSICFKLKQSNKINNLYCLPGNAGTSEISQNIDVDINDFNKLYEIIKNKKIDILVATQIMAKGYHFPNLSLVGIIDADAGLMGGDIKAIGPHPGGAPWKINIRDAHNPGQHQGAIDLYTEGLATSGDYERFIEVNGQRYSHILSPKTGWPVNALSSVTVKAPQCVIAGSACTIAMLMEDDGVDWLNALEVECLWQD